MLCLIRSQYKIISEAYIQSWSLLVCSVFRESMLFLPWLISELSEFLTLIQIYTLLLFLLLNFSFIVPQQSSPITAVYFPFPAYLLPTQKKAAQILYHHTNSFFSIGFSFISYRTGQFFFILRIWHHSFFLFIILPSSFLKKQNISLKFSLNMVFLLTMRTDTLQIINNPLISHLLF